MLTITAIDRGYTDVILHDGCGRVLDTIINTYGAKWSSYEYEVIADGHELYIIDAQITGIRKLTGVVSYRMITWTGEDAKFIIRHLKM